MLPVGPMERLAVTLQQKKISLIISYHNLSTGLYWYCRLLATGDSQQTVAISFRLEKSTVNQIFYGTYGASWDALKYQFLPTPDIAKWNEIKSDFYSLSNFPNCVGAVDGKDVQIKAPPKSGSQLFNYMGIFRLY